MSFQEDVPGLQVPRRLRLVVLVQGNREVDLRRVLEVAALFNLFYLYL